MLNFKVTSIKTMPRSPETEAMVQQHMATKVASGVKGGTLNTNAVTEAMIDKYRAEYQEFLKNLENMDFGSMFAQAPAEEPKSEPVSDAVQEEAVQAFEAQEKQEDLVNGISVGEEAGDTVVIPKTTRKKKKASDEETAV